MSVLDDSKLFSDLYFSKIVPCIDIFMLRMCGKMKFFDMALYICH